MKLTLLAQPVGPWHAVGAGGFSVLVGLLILSVVFFQWPSAHVPFGACVFPFGLLAGLGGFGFSTVALFRSRDRRIVAAALLSAAGILMMVGGLLLAAHRMEHSTANPPAAGKAGFARLSAIGHHLLGLPEPGRWT